MNIINPRRHKPKKVTQRHKRGAGGGGQSDPSTSAFDTIHLIDLIFGTCNELSLYFHLIETTLYLIGFHGSYNHIMTSQAAAIL